jgi:hypothetical protein
MTEQLNCARPLKTLGELRTGTSIPVAVLLTGKDRPIACLEVISLSMRTTTSIQSTTPQLLGDNSHYGVSSEQNKGTESDAMYRACLQELEELLEQVCWCFQLRVPTLQWLLVTSSVRVNIHNNRNYRPGTNESEGQKNAK